MYTAPRTCPYSYTRFIPPPTSAAPRQMGYCCWIFTPAQPVYPTASVRDFLSGAYSPDDNRHSGRKDVGKLTVIALRNIDLSFVREDSLRTVLDDYYSQATKAFTAKAYIGALVACGSVAEGLLTWALTLRESDALSSGKAPKDSNTRQAKPIETWSPAQLITVAIGLKLIGRTAEGAAWALKDFRNFMHPYNVLQQSACADEALALNGFTALHVIVRSLKGRLPH